MTDNSAFLRGTLDVLILRALEGGPRHGYEVVTHLADRSGGTFQIEDGAFRRWAPDVDTGYACDPGYRVRVEAPG